ncbi:MAG: tRNA 4-thiouridine(8) synthase ThiI [Oligoflexia bacterium]|nr:tRNA 4-thiouridine(8) synthase ThiI [Oligoflexia bacterium]MBF0364514.1 tRNA 4-thiouridine(8) synthase ThiI [Oligoflexia bacterium]
MSCRELLLNPDELSLKGRNQKIFVDKLLLHVRAILKAYHPHRTTIVKDHHRHIVSSEADFTEETLRAFSFVPGLHSIHLVKSSPLDIDAALELIKEDLPSPLPSKLSFKVKTTRPNKDFPMQSTDINRYLGHHLLKAYPEVLKVDVHNPELLIHVKVLRKNIYVATKTIKSVGGLPVSSCGHALTLLSGGFDSPAASYLMFRRGIAQTYLFFHSYPFVGEEVYQKVLSLVRILTRYQPRTLLYVIPFGEIQKAIARDCKPAYRTLFFRHYMLCLATKICAKIKASAIITGDSLGQVASQTLPNISLLDNSTPLPILRPLIGYNKSEILNLASTIGTHNISILPQDDACSLLADKHPATHPHLGYWNSFHAENDFTPLLENALQGIRHTRVDWNGNIHEGHGF